ncbi:right-handed parallel beta-helix repeat-containing protein [Coraliomargarita sp. SDUM461003]|uniref:Right-handed parallel beta-helix repeat-containing protein n=1 Tax=Thalassobacterium maritimum TaxID=3041265 RepID=A0ABU1AZR9_9BACT|nr:right-handed parallel beta-helix repeat-containing protein [Coraliomargarita sp. SDUM461003]MDQ8208462.1 right-handed parallel beta-helix repeat-containing protein [Coraliomargarita sp. SDUM461003]
MAFIIAALFSLAVQLPAQLGASELVRNGDFSKWSEGSAAGWKLASSGKASIHYDVNEKPEGAKGSLRIDIEGSGAGEGQVVASKFKVQPNSILFLEGWMKAQKGFIQIKLYKGGKEYQRISVNSGQRGEWTKLEKELDVGDADALAVLLRYNQGSGYVGKSLWFADISVIPAAERIRSAPTIAKLEGVATFSSIGIYADIIGDMSQFTKGYSVFRKKGEQEWRASLPMQWQDKTKQLRSSLLNLEEDTEYEIKTWMEDPNLTEKMEPAFMTVKTWSSEVPIARTVYLPAGEITEPLLITESGSAEGWVRYTGDPSGTTVLNVGMNGANAVKFEAVHHVILDNLTIRGGVKDAVTLRSSTDVRIMRCDISEWGRPGELLPSTNPKWGRGPFYLDENGERINLEGGVRIGRYSSRIVVEDCYIHNPRGRATSWKNGHPLGPTSIILFNSDGNLVIRNNSLIGGEEHRFNDTIEGAYNNYITGGPHRDTDFDGNTMFFSNDDGVELDGGQMNVRFFNNWIQSSYCGVSTAPTILGPSYIYNNLIVLEGEERGQTNFAFKVGGNKVEEPGINYFFHNTIFSNSMALRGGNWGKGPTPLFTRNNLFASGVLLWPQKSKADFDYDMARPNSIDPPLPEWQQNGVTGLESFRDRAAGDYRLSDGSLAIDRALALPMISEEYQGSAPDIGAFQVGASPLFPVREDSVSALPMQLQIEKTLATSNEKADTLYITAPSSTGKRWRILSDEAWLQFSPSNGPCDGKVHEVTVSLKPDFKREGLRQGSITVRTDFGYNRTSFVKAKVRLADPGIQMFVAADLEQRGMTVVESDPNAPVVPYLAAPATRAASSEAYIKFDFEIEEAGVYYLHGLMSVPGPGSPGHDSCFVQVDDGEPGYWDFPVTAPGRWEWMINSIQRKEYPRKMQLSAGKHTIYIRGRESLTRFAKFAVSRSSLPPQD